MQNNTIKIGNVSFLKSDVQKATSRIGKDGDKINSVFLKDGTKVDFWDQKENSNASVIMGHDMGSNGKFGVQFNNLLGFTLSGTKNNDYYYLSNCDYYDINVEENGKDELRIFDSDGSHTKHNEIWTDNSDGVTRINLNENPVINMNEGFFIPRKE